MSMKACKRGHTSGRTKNGTCKECGRLATKKYYAKNATQVREQANSHYHSDPVYRIKARQRARVKAGLPQPTRPEPDVCDCCAQPSRNRALAIDHDHDTGAFRGWLCYNCNLGIGLLGDNMTGIELARRYFLSVEFT